MSRHLYYTFSRYLHFLDDFNWFIYLSFNEDLFLNSYLLYLFYWFFYDSFDIIWSFHYLFDILWFFNNLFNFIIHNIFNWNFNFLFNVIISDNLFFYNSFNWSFNWFFNDNIIRYQNFLVIRNWLFNNYFDFFLNYSLIKNWFFLSLNNLFILLLLSNRRSSFLNLKFIFILFYILSYVSGSTDFISLTFFNFNYFTR